MKDQSSEGHLHHSYFIVKTTKTHIISEIDKKGLMFK